MQHYLRDVCSIYTEEKLENIAEVNEISPKQMKYSMFMEWKISIINMSMLLELIDLS